MPGGVNARSPGGRWAGPRVGSRNPRARALVSPTTNEGNHIMRANGRAADELRPVLFEPGVNKYAEGSCLVRFGDTHVLCTASVENTVPPFLRNSGRGGVMGEYCIPAPAARAARLRGATL